MSDRVRCLTALLIFPMLAAACGSGRQPSTPTLATVTSGPTATSTRVPTRTPGPTWTPRPSATTDPCTPRQVVQTLRGFIPYEESVIYYNEIDGERYLIVWFVDPDVDPQPSAEDVELQAARAEVDAILLAFQLNEHVYPCLVDEFEMIFVAAVDRQYQAWFAGHIMTDSLAPASDPTMSQFDESEIHPVFIREQSPALEDRGGSPAAESNWPQVRRQLATFEDFRPGVEGTYLFSDDVGVHVWTQRQISGDPMSVVFELWDIAPAIADLVPPPDYVWVTVVDQRARLTLFATVPGEAFRSEVYPGEIMENLEVVGP